MSDIVIRFDMRLGAKWTRVALAGVLMFSVVPELGSESVTLSTYYPAPSGVYTNMIATGNTYLARDSGNVGVGTASPTSKLHVNGTATISGATAVNAMLSVTPGTPGVAINVAQNSTYRIGNAYLSSGGNYMHLATNEYYNGSSWIATGGTGALMQMNGQTVTFYTHNGAGSHTQTMNISAAGDMSMPSRITISGASADVTGHVIARGQNACNTSHIRTYATTGTTSCPGGTYATLQSGVISKYVMMPRYADIGTGLATAWMLCCPCPGGAGCPSLL